MNRATVSVLVLVLAAAAPAAAQLAGMPMWNSPKGGAGVTLSGDYGMPGDDAGGGTAFGARASLGFSKFTVGLAYASYEPDGASEATQSFGGTAAFRVIGGGLSPLNVNIIGGGATTAELTGPVSFGQIGTYWAGAGVSVSLPFVEPYATLSNRWITPSGGSSESAFGWTLGANVTMGMFGLHLAYDSQDVAGTTVSSFGAGLHVTLGVPGL